MHNNAAAVPLPFVYTSTRVERDNIAANAQSTDGSNSNKKRGLNGDDRPVYRPADNWNHQSRAGNESASSLVLPRPALGPFHAPPSGEHASIMQASSTSEQVSGMNQGSEPNSQSHWASSPYPDVSSYQHNPYFYQQTDPSIYTSPWPPVAEKSNHGQMLEPLAPMQSAGMSYYQQPARPMAQPGIPDGGMAGMNPYQQDVDSHPQYTFPAATSAVDRMVKPPSSLYVDDASSQMKTQSLSILDNLATQLVHTIAKATFAQIQEFMSGVESEESQAYSTLKNLFDSTRKVYSRETPFIDAIRIQMFQPTQQEVIRKANIATFISSILGAHDVSFYHLNEHFMETFVPLGHRLLKWQGAIYLELKTQAYISALMNSDSGNPESMLDELFPADMDAQILTRHPDAPSLSPSEQDFIDRSRARKAYLLADPSDADDSASELSRKYSWNDFVREFASCISKNSDGIMNVPARGQPVFGAQDRRGIPHDSPYSMKNGQINHGGPGGMEIIHGNSNNITGASSSTPNTANDPPRKAPVPATTVRQPWTRPEEDALLSGLERVSGPHWSQILALYGRGGSVSEVLKDRNQVQLKDKARNLKLWYLKTNREVPVSLRGVTGELRKRGGARARAALGLMDEQAGKERDGETEGGIDPGLDEGEVAGGRSLKKSRS